MYHVYWIEPLRQGLQHHYCKTVEERNKKLQDLQDQADRIGWREEPNDSTKLNEEE